MTGVIGALLHHALSLHLRMQLDTRASREAYGYRQEFLITYMVIGRQELRAEGWDDSLRNRRWSTGRQSCLAKNEVCHDTQKWWRSSTPKSGRVPTIPLVRLPASP